MTRRGFFDRYIEGLQHKVAIMGVNNILILYQVTFYLLSLILSLCILLPVSFHLYDFKGHCLLFTNGTWRESDGKFIADWASQVFCDYNVLWAFISLILSLTQIYRFISHLCRETDAGFLGAFIDVIVNILMTLASFAGALIITMGYQVFCDAIMQRFLQCEDATINKIMEDDKIDTSMFYTQFGTAQFGAWCCWVCWIGLSVSALLKVCKYHHQENIRATMAQERARLIGANRRNNCDTAVET